MSLVIAENIGHLFGAQEVFRAVSFALAASDRVGLVGPNGEGKTTLLRIITGEIEPTVGRLHVARGTRIGHLPQDPPALLGTSVRDCLEEVFAEARDLERRMSELSSRIAEAGERAPLEEYAKLEERFEALGGYGYHVKVEQVLEGVGFSRELSERRLETLSGGELHRVHLARLLLEEPDVLLLDEPTNHLDMNAADWLEGRLKEFSGALVVVSHDRYFLDRVTTATWEVVSLGLETYKASYTGYRKQRADRHKTRLRKYQAQQEYVEKTREFIRIHIAGQRSKEAKGRRKRLERFLREDAIEEPLEERTVSLRLTASQRAGNLVLVAEDLAIGYDEVLVTAERLEIERGERVAIVGANGAGKTTLLKTLIGQLAPLRGSVRIGASVEFGYLSQTHAQLDGEATALDAVLGAGDRVSAQKARDVLGGLLLGGSDVYKSVSQLSGGERSRVVLATLAIQDANVLVLDEPTNHLDIPTTEIMEQLLAGFDGTLVMVSHDRYLVEAVATRVWALEGGRVFEFHGGWRQYADWKAGGGGAGSGAGAGREVAPDGAKTQRRRKRKTSRREANERQRLERRHNEVEREVAKAESRLSGLGKEITAAGEASDLARVEELGGLYAECEKDLAYLWDEWESVGERLE